MVLYSLSGKAACCFPCFDECDSSGFHAVYPSAYGYVGQLDHECLIDTPGYRVWENTGLGFHWKLLSFFSYDGLYLLVGYHVYFSSIFDLCYSHCIALSLLSWNRGRTCTKKKKEKHSIKALLYKKEYLFFLILLIAMNIPVNNGYTYATYLLLEVNGELAMLGVFSGIRAACEIPCVLLCGKLLKRIDAGRLICVPAILMICEQFLYIRHRRN